MKCSLLLIIVPVFALAKPAAAQTVRVATDPRAEVLWIMFRTAGAPEFSSGSLQPYIRQIDSTFGAFKSHAAIAEINQRRDKHRVSLNAVISMAAHISDPITFGERASFDSPSSTLDGRWQGAEVRPFLQAARDFARDAPVAEFLRAQAPLYDSASARVQRLVRRANMGWFNAFFGQPPGAVFIVAPLLANAGGNFATRFENGSSRELYAYLSLIQADSLGFPIVFDDQLRTIVHEFNHSFVNHVVSSQSDSLQPSGERIYATVGRTMRLMAYASWKTMIDESMVRASVIRYLNANEGWPSAEREIRSQQGLGFIWIDELVRLLADYESSRTTYPTLTSFMPKVVAYYQGLAPRIDSMQAAFDSRRPAIIASSIADGAKDVDPGLTAITVLFDRKMGPGISMSPSGGSFPQVTSYAFDSSGTAFTLRVKLEAKRAYGIRFHGYNFASTEGHPLKEYVIRFTTK